MKPSKKCKAAGLTGLAELVKISGMKYRTLLHWAKNTPDKFDFVVRAAGAEKSKKEQQTTHKGYTIEFNQKPFVFGHDYDVYKDGEEEQGFTAESVERAVEMINEIEE